MWFKNLQIYRLTKSFDLSPEALHEVLERRMARDCGSLEPFAYGWDRPLGRHGTLLTHTTGGCIMICARRVEKILPATVVRERLDEKVEEITEAEGRKVRRREKEEIKGTILQQLLPQAFSKSLFTHAYIDPRAGWLIVDASSVKRAEELITLLRETLGTLPLKPLVTANSPTGVMTAWLSGRGGVEDFVVQDECELRDPTEEGGVVRCRQQDLGGEEIQTHLNAGKQVVRLAIEWDERIAFLLCDDFSIKRLKFLEVIQEEAAEIEAEDAATRFDADFSLMSLELERFIPRLLAQFGGLEEE